MAIQPARHECHACCLLRAGFLAFQPVVDNTRGTRLYYQWLPTMCLKPLLLQRKKMRQKSILSSLYIEHISIEFISCSLVVSLFVPKLRMFGKKRGDQYFCH